MENISTPLAELLRIEAYQERTANLFPGIESLRWYIRIHRQRLLECGALLVVTGRQWIDPIKFDKAVIDAASRGTARGQKRSQQTEIA